MGQGQVRSTLTGDLAGLHALTRSALQQPIKDRAERSSCTQQRLKHAGNSIGTRLVAFGQTTARDVLQHAPPTGRQGCLCLPSNGANNQGVQGRQCHDRSASATSSCPFLTTSRRGHTGRSQRGMAMLQSGNLILKKKQSHVPGGLGCPLARREDAWFMRVAAETMRLLSGRALLYGHGVAHCRRPFRLRDSCGAATRQAARRGASRHPRRCPGSWGSRP